MRKGLVKFIEPGEQESQRLQGDFSPSSEASQKVANVTDKAGVLRGALAGL